MTDAISRPPYPLDVWNDEQGELHVTLVAPVCDSSSDVGHSAHITDDHLRDVTKVVTTGSGGMVQDTNNTHHHRRCRRCQRASSPR